MFDIVFNKLMQDIRMKLEFTELVAVNDVYLIVNKSWRAMPCQ